MTLKTDKTNIVEIYARNSISSFSLKKTNGKFNNLTITDRKASALDSDTVETLYNLEFIKQLKDFLNGIDLETLEPIKTNVY